MFGLSMNIIAQALEVYKRAISVGSRNVANANNEDYVREEPLITSHLYSGITLEEVRREQNFYLINLRNQKLSYVSYLSEREEALKTLESALQEMSDGLGLTDSINKFFQAYLELMKEPTNEGAKQTFLRRAEGLVNTLKVRFGELQSTEGVLKKGLQDYVNRVNELVKKLHEVNREITFKYSLEYAREKDYKTLLDLRDKYLKELSQYLPIRATQDEMGRVSVSTVKGFALVDFHNAYYTLRYEDGAIKWKDGSDITPYINSGKIGGALRALEDVQEVKTKLNEVVSELLSVKIPVGAGEESVFTGTDITNLSVESNLENNLSNLDTTRTAQYSQMALSWWENTKSASLRLTDYVASNLNSVVEEKDLEEALYNSLQEKILQRQGVSIDQEIMEIIQLQRNYEAVAQVLSRIDELLRTTINMI